MTAGHQGDIARTTLVVGDAGLADELAGLGQVITVDSYLHALGEMSRQTVHAVIGRIEPMTGAMDATVAALRQLAPTGRLILVVDADQEPLAMRAVRLGVDDYLVRPVTSQQIIAALADAVGLPTVEPAAPGVVIADEVSAPEPITTTDRMLGDTDLITTLLDDPERLGEVAVELIRQRVGGAKVNWSIARPRGACAEVAFGEQRLGYLSGEGVEAEMLANCAGWLGHWLALGEQMASLRQQALRDELTGVWNRRYFDRFLKQILQRAREERFRVTLMVYDIDDFKGYNDQFGHAAGDEILCETAKLMRSVVRQHDVVARIGGDEFAVIFWDAEAPRRQQSEHPHTVRTAAGRFQKAVCEHRFPKLGEMAPATLTISGGLASYPWDGADPQQLLQRADEALLESKRQGKNCVTFGPGAMKACGMQTARDQAGDSEV